MAVLPIVILGDPALHAPTEPVTGSPEEIRDLVRDLYETMDAANGVGLAANQVGVRKRVFVYDCPDLDTEDGEGVSREDVEARGGWINRRGCVVNPVLETSEIPETMPDPEEDLEGCLSVPGVNFPRGRAWWARVTGTDENGEPVSVEGYGLFARCLQHEVGHLDGVLYTDGLIGRNRKAAKRHIRDAGWGVPGLSWDPTTDPDPFADEEDDDDEATDLHG
ncbi:MAG: peptide deformylase [Dietzia sp.]|uniref:peptide deformylase n=1 Tax=unclassified Dietzia TaxID=2617939 RepID=UPI0015FE6C53|nr:MULTISPECIES: peptide deformylase [unclassified Dietzia]MBB1039765.1 peptide deformylase [Dietzia sp. Cai40]MBB1043896.1 peptide deformylase [Dietzia sp. DQ11-44]MBB1051967.1 peptide deformylase [Dietzia sp. CW19]MBB1057056.1 peptide deformylase [Dietzia sp. B19]MDO8393789.1 peptide deformylase [Dietzia sp.]